MGGGWKVADSHVHSSFVDSRYHCGLRSGIAVGIYEFEREARVSCERVVETSAVVRYRDRFVAAGEGRCYVLVGSTLWHI